MPQLFIDGQWVPARGGEVREIRCPADGTLVGEVDEAGRDDTAAAIAAARSSFDAGSWRGSAAQERGDLLLRVADLLRRDHASFARAESLDTGKRLVESQADIDDVIKAFRYYGKLAGENAGRIVDTGDAAVASRVVHEPVGVCGLITPWNFPLLQTSWKVAPCLAAGNSFVLKPSELTPHTAILLMGLLEEAGLPAGAGNLVLGAGGEVGAPLATDPRVDLVSFTGGLATGRGLMAAAAGTVKRVALELGGKNPNIVFADADYDVALDYAMAAVFVDSGQVCSAGARLVIEESLHDRFVSDLVERAERIRLGGPFDDTAEAGPLISAAHREKVERYVARGIEEGAVLRCGGTRPDDDDLATGYFFRPTVLDGCDSSMTVTQDESFGPVLTVETFTTEDEAVAVANDSIYGLAGAVWTNDAGKGQRVANRMRMGTVWINDYHPYAPQAEWGGYQQSGIGRELGPAGLDEYRETKHIWHNIQPTVQGWFGE